MQLSYGSPSDTGIECILANAVFAMSSMIPTEIKTHWDATNIDYNSILNNDTQVATGEDQNLPAMKVQITNSTNASTAIAIGLAHPLADAHSPLTFTKDWAATNRALPSAKLPPRLTSLLKPELLSVAAAEDIDAATPDPAILETVVKLPIHRLDYWASG